MNFNLYSIQISHTSVVSSSSLESLKFSDNQRRKIARLLRGNHEIFNVDYRRWQEIVRRARTVGGTGSKTSKQRGGRRRAKFERQAREREREREETGSGRREADGGRKTQETREEESSGGWSKNSFRMALVSPFTADLRRSAALVTHLATKTKRTASQERPLPSVQITLAISLSTNSRFWLSGNFDDAAVPIPPPTRSRRSRRY